MIVRYIPYSTGYSPKDWHVLVDTIIEKKGKRNLVSNLWIINLIEADFNFNNKVMTRNATRCVEQNNLIPIEQYRS